MNTLAIQTLDEICTLFPLMTAEQKEHLLGFGEGVIFMMRQQMQLGQAQYQQDRQSGAAARPGA